MDARTLIGTFCNKLRKKKKETILLYTYTHTHTHTHTHTLTHTSISERSVLYIHNRYGKNGKLYKTPIRGATAYICGNGYYAGRDENINII